MAQHEENLGPLGVCESFFEQDNCDASSTLASQPPEQEERNERGSAGSDGSNSSEAGRPNAAQRRRALRAKVTRRAKLVSDYAGPVYIVDGSAVRFPQWHAPALHGLLDFKGWEGVGQEEDSAVDGALCDYFLHLFLRGHAPNIVEVAWRVFDALRPRIWVVRLAEDPML